MDLVKCPENKSISSLRLDAFASVVNYQCYAAKELRSQMEGNRNHSVCRLCLLENGHLLDVFESKGIPGWTAANAITELLGIQVYAGDEYQKCVCIKCMGILEDFKTFKQRCESNKKLLDRAYAVKFGIVQNEQILEGGSGIPLEKDPFEMCNPIKREIEDSVDGYDEIPHCGINEVYIPVKSEFVKQVPNDPCNNSFDGCIKEESVEVMHEPHSDGYLEEDIPVITGRQSTLPAANNSLNSPQGDEGCHNRGDNVHSASYFVQQIDCNGPSCQSVSVGERHSTGSDHKSIESNTTSSLPAKMNHSCEVCWTQFGHIEDLEDHLNSHGMPKSFICNFCNRGFCLNDCLKQHTCELKIKLGIKSVPKHFACDLCCKEFSCASKLQIHKMGHTGEIPFECNKCNMRFYIKGNLKKHMIIHSGDRAFKCDQCDKTFSQKGHLKTHMIGHKGERCFKCAECHKMFLHKSNLKSHTATHSTERPFQCSICQRRFLHKGYLKTHMHTHSTEKPFRCQQCDKSFSYKSKYRTHMISHSGERPFPCNQCDKVFLQNSHLKTHMMTHITERPYKCNECCKTFSYKSVLKTHIMTHSGEKPHECQQCNRVFSQKCHLNVHLRTHSGDWPLKCDICRKRYSRKNSLRKHIMSHSDAI